MKLQRLIITGFKTFADRTTLEAGPGITAIVGPNGSGKSNIADALMWVLGEQNPRSLRASDAKEIIFAGCKTRKPLGMAEVRLVLDNSDLALPIQLAEVTVTRRIFRSGETQYLINSTPCRLKDVTDLFLDTGAGRGAYAIVGQGEIDAVLSARPEERRELFEEAAGIKKYRTRKREALRKLEAAEANLQRVRDILAELEQQREPLAVQAEAARRYNALTQRLHAIELQVLISEASRTQAELAALRQERKEASRTVARLDSELAIMERETETAGRELAQAEHEQDAAALSRQSALTALERLDSRLRLAEERAASAQAAAEKGERELAELAQRKASLRNELQEALAQHEAAAEQTSRSSQALQAAREELKVHEQRMLQAQSRLEEMRTRWTRAAQQQAEARAAAEANRARLAELNERLAELERRAQQLDDEQQRTQEALEELAAREQQLAAEHADLRSRMEHLSALRAARQTQLQEARKEEEAARMRLAETSTRLSVLQEMHAAGEGLYQGVRAVLKAVREGSLSGPFWPVVDLLTVPAEHRTAIETALGPAMQDLVCLSGDAARQAIEWLKRTRTGRVTFLPLDLLSPPAPLRPDLLQAVEGIVGVASGLVECDARFKPVLDLLLGRTVVARDLPSAIRAARRLRGWSRIVTADGELMTPAGAITGGSASEKGVHLVARKGEMDDLARAIRILSQSLQDKAASATRAQERLGEVEAELKDCQETLSRCGVARAELASRIREAERERSNLASRALAARNEAERLQQAVRELHLEVASLEASASQHASPEAECDALLAEAQDQLRALQSAAEAARQRVTRIEVEHARAQERQNAVKNLVQRLQASLGELRAAVSAAERERQSAVESRNNAMASAAQIEQERAQVQALLVQHQEQWTYWRDRRQSLLTANYERSAAMKEARTRRSEVVEALHAADLKIARTEARLAQTLERLTEEYGITKEEALQREPEPVEQAPEQTAREIASLRREIKAMGPVNTGALEEYERLSARLNFLAEQRNDLEDARRSLAATIAEIDANSRSLFLDTFQAVSRQFEELFQRLFRGGSARIRLTDTADPLEAGIEIAVQPPGKTLQPLSLLSGGERALVAITLLFSFLAVRPSPFCILDEVDAALDGANVEHFADLLRDFAASTQFLVITHNPATIACADRWYGVTMEEPGVSKVLHYRVPPSSASAASYSAHSAPIP